MTIAEPLKHAMKEAAGMGMMNFDSPKDFRVPPFF